jgi:hypothetical protein
MFPLLLSPRIVAATTGIGEYVARGDTRQLSRLRCLAAAAADSKNLVDLVWGGQATVLRSVFVRTVAQRTQHMLEYCTGLHLVG